MRAGRMKRRDEDRVGFRAACLARFAGIMDGHHYQQAEPAGLWRATDVALTQVNAVGAPAPRCIGHSSQQDDEPPCSRGAHQPAEQAPARPKSEEHTSELQSLMRISYAVFCLKKKKIETCKRADTSE